MSIYWEGILAPRMGSLNASEIRELLKLIEQADIISFAGGIPAPDLFPVAAIERAYRDIFDGAARTAGAALQYTITEGYPPLRQWIAARLGTEPDGVLITNGSQQVLDFLGKALINRGDLVAVSAPTYLGALQAFSVYEPTYAMIPMDAHGIVIADLEAALARRPKFLYLVPDFQNPNGITLSLERRRVVLDLCRAYGVPVVEDCAYADLCFDGEPLPSLFALDAERQRRDDGIVLQAGTFSKSIAPALRVGWVAGPRPILQKLVLVKQAADLHTSTINQMVMHAVVESIFDSHITLLRTAYRARRDAMLAALEEYFPPSVRWTQPRGGLFIWLELPPPLSGSALLERSIREQRVAFVPGSAFYADRSGEHTCRLSFSVNQTAQIREGIRRLALLVNDVLKETRRTERGGTRSTPAHQP